MHLTKSLPSLSLRRRIGALFAGLIAANIGVWVWAFSLFHAQPLMLGTAVLAWGLGLRHAVDADHIAAIDNVTRKLMQDIHAITDAEKRDGYVEHGSIDNGRSSVIHTGRATGQNDALRAHLPNALKRDIVRMDFVVDVCFTNASGDELGVLTAEIKNENHSVSR